MLENPDDLPPGSTDTPIRLCEPTLADVLTEIERDASLPKSKREAWCCSGRRIAGERLRKACA